jgi:hypothetical protein
MLECVSCRFFPRSHKWVGLLDRSSSDAWGYKWATLFLEEIRVNIGTCPSRMQKSENWVTLYSDQRKIALARPSRYWKLQTRPLVREGAPHQQTRNCPQIILKEEEKLVTILDVCLTRRQTGWLNTSDYQPQPRLQSLLKRDNLCQMWSGWDCIRQLLHKHDNICLDCAVFICSDVCKRYRIPSCALFPLYVNRR